MALADQIFGTKVSPRINGLPAQLDSAAYVGRKVIIVGGTGGLGRALSLRLTSLGAHVTVVGQTFRDAGIANIEFVFADLSLLQEAKRVADLLLAQTADLLIFTTGIFAAPEREVTREGIERDMAVSFLSRLVMLRAIAPRLGKIRLVGQFKPRIFVMGHPGTGQTGNPADLNSETSYQAVTAHMNTVAGNEALVLESALRYPELEIFGLNPGIVKTAIRSNFLGEDSLKHRIAETAIGLLTQSPDHYAKRIAPLLTSPCISGFSGAFFNNKGQEIKPSSSMNDRYVADYIRAAEALTRRAGDVILRSDP
jgi:NAD(P)-dependent dehydrogenase (short-subunit alcohol dehydrogenase family)